jgi:hypothetical protein
MQRLTLLFASIAALTILLLAPRVQADDFSVTLTQDGTVLPGGMVDFDATITNISSGTLFINGDEFSAAFPLLLDDTNFVIYFLLGPPVSLDSGQTLTDVDVFTITVDPSALAGDYGGSYGFTGGADEFATDDLGSADFDVVVSSPAVTTPEPGTLCLLCGGLGIVAWLYRRRELKV